MTVAAPSYDLRRCDLAEIAALYGDVLRGPYAAIGCDVWGVERPRGVAGDRRRRLSRIVASVGR